MSEAQRLEDSEELHQTLLNSISHEMRTPLTAILGAASALNEDEMASKPAFVKEVAESLQAAGDRLNRVIENLLDMSRLNSGVLSLNLEWHDLNDLIGVVIQKNKKILEKHRLEVKGLEEIILVPQAMIMKKVWGVLAEGESHYLRIYINQLRKKIEIDPSNPKHILTDPGVGYRLV